MRFDVSFRALPSSDFLAHCENGGRIVLGPNRELLGVVAFQTIVTDPAGTIYLLSDPKAVLL